MFKYTKNLKKNIKKKFLKEINILLRRFNYKLDKLNNLFYLHKYSSYKEYVSIQRNETEQGFNDIWADQKTLYLVSRRLIKNLKKKENNKQEIKGCCHGCRNGFEVFELRNLLKSNEIIGTDISKKVKKIDGLEVWDFHKKKSKWKYYFDFIYTNSLDQSIDPILALTTWLNQIKLDGLIFIEYTRDHGVTNENGQLSSSEIDPFGILPEFLPYYLIEYFGMDISIDLIKSFKKNNQKEVWIFVLSKNKLKI